MVVNFENLASALVGSDPERAGQILSIKNISSDYREKVGYGTPSSMERHDRDIIRMKQLGNELKGRGFTPTDFLFWHLLVSSSMEDNEVNSLPLDTPSGDIESFIKKMILE